MALQYYVAWVMAVQYYVARVMAFQYYVAGVMALQNYDARVMALQYYVAGVMALQYYVAWIMALQYYVARVMPSQYCYIARVMPSQCREIRTTLTSATHMDTLIIAASAAICGTVILAVMMFICCSRRQSVQQRKQGIPAILNPSSPPLASLGTLGSGINPDWDSVSMYSQRSIPRAKMYHMEKDLSMSRQSLAAPQFGVGRLGSLPVNPSDYGMGASNSTTTGRFTRATSYRNDRRRQRSKSRERTTSRHSHEGSSHSLTGYDTDGCTDHDMDIYIARNPTRGGLVQL
nr:uncharacterized protein LOC128685244 [Cherax quadricarinatus]